MTSEKIRQEIINDPANQHKSSLGISPLFTAPVRAKIVIVGQAPGRVAEETNKPWNDESGQLLREWLGLHEKAFYGPHVSLLPMDFYYPGKAAHGDLPPRKDFAPKWHPKLLACMPQVSTVILIGAYAQKFYLDVRVKKNLTETVRTFDEYLPEFIPLPHPSPLNRRWLAKNEWYGTRVVPEVRNIVARILA